MELFDLYGINLRNGVVTMFAFLQFNLIYGYVRYHGNVHLSGPLHLPSEHFRNVVWTGDCVSESNWIDSVVTSETNRIYR